MPAEADQRHRPERGNRHGRHRGDAQALARARGRQHEERQREPGGHLHPESRHQRAGGSAKAPLRARGERERCGQREHDQRVVVRAAERQHEQHRVQADEGRRPAARAAGTVRGAGDERDRAEARRERHRLQRPRARRYRQRRQRIAAEREQGTVGGVLERPSDEGEGGVGGRFCRQVRVRVQAVQGVHPREAQIAEDVLGDERRAEEEDHLRGDDRTGDRAQRKLARAHEHGGVTGAQHQRVRLKARPADRETKTMQGTRQPARPASAARGHVLRGRMRRAGGDRRRARDDRCEPGPAERSQQTLVPRPRLCCGGPVVIAARLCPGWEARRPGEGRHRTIVASAPPVGPVRRPVDFPPLSDAAPARGCARGFSRLVGTRSAGGH